MFRPVEVDGAQIQPLPPQLLHHMLPMLSEQELENKSIPAGFIFGYVSFQHHEAIIQQGLESLSAGIKPLNLRVFRLHHIEYRYIGNQTSQQLPSSLSWTMELPHWVKINPSGNGAYHKEL